MPQLHEGGVLLRFHPYLRHSASRNSSLCRKNPCSVTGKTVSHADDPSLELVLLSVVGVGSTVQVYVVLVVLVVPFFFSSWRSFLSGYRSGYHSSAHPVGDLVP